jgi:hypothetical protein
MINGCDRVVVARRQPNSVGYGLPENCPKDEGVPTFRSLQWQAVGKHSILKDRQRFFCRCNQLRT